MEYRAEIDVMPLKALLDPQGKAVGSSLKNMGLGVITNVRIGKHITPPALYKFFRRNPADKHNNNIVIILSLGFLMII